MLANNSAVMAAIC